jgi:hypothetical protein
MKQEPASSKQQGDEGTTDRGNGLARQRGNEVLWLRLAGLAAILLVLIRLVGCRAGGVGEAEKRWQASNVVDYHIQVREVQSTWCYYEIDLEVRGGQVVTGTVTAYPGPARNCWNYTGGVIQEPVALSPDQAARWTVPGLLEIARQWEGLAGQKDMDVDLEFDPQLGYPIKLHKDNMVAYDDDTGLEVLQFEPVGP